MSEALYELFWGGSEQLLWMALSLIVLGLQPAQLQAQSSIISTGKAGKLGLELQFRCPL